MREERRTQPDSALDDRTVSNRARTGEEVRLAQLDELDDYEVADGYPDPRGWDVKARDGRKVGEVKHLLVDRQALRVAYLEVELERELSPDGYRGRDRERLVHVPVESAQLADGDDEVFVDLDRTALAGLGLADRTRPVVGSPEEHRRFFGAPAEPRRDPLILASVRRARRHPQ